MQRALRDGLFAFLIFLLISIFQGTTQAQAQAPGTAVLREVHAEGVKKIAEAQLVALTKLEIGSMVGRPDLQAAADNLVKSGLFAKVNYNFQTHSDGVVVTFHVEESPRIPAYFDNIPWFSDSELGDAILKQLPFFDGTLPEGGSAVDQASDSINQFLAAHGMHVAVDHQVQPNPLGDGSVQAFQLQGAALLISKLEFSDPALASSRVIQAHLSEIVGKPYSRMAIEVFLSEQVRPVYLSQGFLKAKLGPPEVRLTGNPNQKLSEQIPVFVPVVQGPVYHWKGGQWSGNSALSTFTLSGALGLKSGDVADGMAIEAGWDRVREEYGQRGYLEAKVDPVASFDDQARTVSYDVKVEEGKQFRFGSLVLTGISITGEKRLKETFPVQAGEFFDKAKFEEYLTNLQTHPAKIFGDLPIHYDTVGHWLQTDPAKGSVDVLLDFK
jgi:outer membrane protein assembly factor BamA